MLSNENKIDATGREPGKIIYKNHGVVQLSHEVNLTCGRVHEILGASADIFAVLAAALIDGPTIWAGRSGDVETIAPTGLQNFINPSHFIIVSCITRDEVLWAAEQALRLPGAACVIAELNEGPDLKTSRRLQIAAEEGGGLGIVLIKGRAQTSSAQTRWLCEPCDDENNTWVWQLTKNKEGRTGVWRAHWSNDNGRSDNAPGLVLMATTSAA